MSLPDRVLRTVRMHRMIPAGGRVLAAVSGGSDSVALVLLIRELEEKGEFSLTGIAHLNHGLRGSACDDEEFCRALAARLRVPFHVQRIAIREMAREQRRSIEDAARVARYDFFSRARDEAGAHVVATGHTRDDQAETFLLRLLRGAGTRGLAGIRPVAGHVVRPLIETRREELRQYLSERGEPFCEDETNRDTSIPRNRVRHELIPYLEREFSAGITDVLAREADLARRDDDRLQNEAIDSSGLIVLRNSGGKTVALTPEQATGSLAGATARADIAAVEIDVTRLSALHPALASRLARIALSILAPDRFVGFDHVEALLSLASASSGAVSLPGQQAVRRESRIELMREPFRGFANSFSFPLSIPGEVTLGAQGWAVSAHMGEGFDSGAFAHGTPEPVLATAVQADRLALPLAVRSRRAGDRFKPFGLGGRTKKLQDFLVDSKVAREQRDFLPLVVDNDDRIVWIVGQPAAEDFRVTEPSQGVIFLKARRLGGQG
jgi:tRNA(Ile)-lysidine synthase